MRLELDGLNYTTHHFIAPGGCSTILSNVLDVLHHSENDHATHQPTPKTIVSHIHPAACPNMVALMKALVTGFVDRRGDEDEDEDDSLGRVLNALDFPHQSYSKP